MNSKVDKVRRTAAVKPVDRAIDRVVRDHGGSQVMPEFDLQDLFDLAPAEGQPHSQLEQLLALPTIGEYITQALRPRLDSGELMSPTAFRDVLDETLAGLRDVAEQHPPAARALGRLARLLNDEANLRDLLRMYRSALLQG